MAGFVPNAFRARLLEAAAGRTALPTANLFLGLAVSVPEDPLTTTLSNLVEVQTAGYARKQVPAFAAASTVSPVRITVPTDFEFAPLEADMTEGAFYAFLTDAASGTSGVVRYLWTFGTPLVGRYGKPLAIPANTLIIE